jgi:hypothetical protein
MGIHILCCVHDNELTWTHDVIHDTFVAIMWGVGFHVGWEQLHALPLNTFNSSFQWIDIMFSKDDIRTVVNNVIANPTWVDLLLQFYATQGFVTFDAAQAKEQNYRDWHLTDQFLPIIVEVFGCLHKHVDVFLHNCANVIWNLKGP